MKAEDIVEIVINEKPRTFIAKDISIKLGDKTVDKDGNFYVATTEAAVEALTKDEQFVLIPYIKPFQP